MISSTDFGTLMYYNYNLKILFNYYVNNIKLYWNCIHDHNNFYHHYSSFSAFIHSPSIPLTDILSWIKYKCLVFMSWMDRRVYTMQSTSLSSKKLVWKLLYNFLKKKFNIFTYKWFHEFNIIFQFTALHFLNQRQTFNVMVGNTPTPAEVSAILYGFMSGDWRICGLQQVFYSLSFN